MKDYKAVLLYLLLIIQFPILVCARDVLLNDRLKAHVSFLASDSLEGRGLGTDGKILAKQYIAGQFQAAGLKPFGEDFFHHMSLMVGVARIPGTNIIGYLPGNDPEISDEFIVIGAHYDHLGYVYGMGERVVFPGADDNASGVAVVIELARLLSQKPEALGRSILFIAFDGEESGLLGAREFIGDRGFVEPAHVKLMFSLDMVGMYKANNGVNLLGMGTLNNGIAIANQLAGQEGVRLRRTTRDIAVRTDSKPFADVGIPAVHVFTGSKSPYHKPEDTYDLLDYDGMADITLFMQSFTEELSVKPELLPSRQFVRMQNPRALLLDGGFITHIGSANHIFPDEFYDANAAFAFGAGIFLQLHLGNRYFLQSEVLYDLNGSQSAEGVFRRHSLTLPLNLNYHLTGGPGEFLRAYPFAGGYYRYSFSGSDGDTRLDFDGVHPTGEWGFNAGFGMEIMRFMIAYTWRIGLSDISSQQGRTTRTKGYYFTLGYRF